MHDQRHSWRHSLTAALLLLWLAGIGLRLTILAVPPVLAMIRDDFGLSATEVGLLSSIPPALFAIAALAGSLLVARLGVTVALVGGLVLVAAGSALRLDRRLVLGLGLGKAAKVYAASTRNSPSARCGIPPQVTDQLKTGHKNTESMQKKVCTVALQQQQQQKGPAGPSLSEVLGSSAALPEAAAAKKSGGSTFDTLNGNVLAR